MEGVFKHRIFGMRRKEKARKEKKPVDWAYPISYSLANSKTLPKRARIALWRARIIKTAPAFSLCEAVWAWARDLLEKPFAVRGKRGMIALEGRRSSFRGRMDPCGDSGLKIH